MSLDKTRRGRLGYAAFFAACALFETYIARHAQINHTVVRTNDSWFTPEVGYLRRSLLVRHGCAPPPFRAQEIR
jgi:hypothetical protein